MMRHRTSKGRRSQQTGSSSANLQNRTGSALLLALILTISIAGLATSAIYLSGNSSILATSFEQERDLKYAAEAALAIGKSRLNSDPMALPLDGYATILEGETIIGADGKPVDGISVNLHIGPTSSSTGQFGRFASVVAEAVDTRGSKFVRRLELAQESFAKFAYWTDVETNMNQPILFGGNDQLWGPVWSNDMITISAQGGATFHSQVGTAKTVTGVEYGQFLAGFEENLKPIRMPDNSSLVHLPGYASSGKFKFVAPNSDSTKKILMRIEFVNIDLNGDGKSDGFDEGFFRVYTATSDPQWLRSDWSSRDLNCGAFYNIGSGNSPKFVPIAEHSKQWFKDALARIAFPNRAKFYANPITDSLRVRVLERDEARCYLGGDPHLKAVSLTSTAYAAATSLSGVAVAEELGGSPSAFNASGPRGQWVKWTGSVDSRLAGRPDREYLFPLHRSQNPGAKGVIQVDGSVAVSGNLRGRVTLYATGHIVFPDDLKYSIDPATGKCYDILGVISAHDIAVANNSIQAPQAYYPNVFKKFGGKSDVFLHGIMMALNTSFFVEDFGEGATTASECGGRPIGRGCLYLTGGLIQRARGAVGRVGDTYGFGFIKRYSYDRCAMYDPPPYFPTTGRYNENRYYEIDPMNYEAGKLFSSLRPKE